MIVAKIFIRGASTKSSFLKSNNINLSRKSEIKIVSRGLDGWGG